MTGVKPPTPLGPQLMRRILGVTDALGIHRESVRVPLLPRGAGALRITETDMLEIVAPAEGDLESWVVELPEKLRELDLSRLRRSG
jgi:hypothetical protein